MEYCKYSDLEERTGTTVAHRQGGFLDEEIWVDSSVKFNYFIYIYIFSYSFNSYLTL